METVNTIIRYLYIPLIIAIIVILFVLLGKIRKIGRTIKATSPQLEHIAKNIEEDKKKLEFIEKTKPSFEFFASLSVILVIIKEAFKYRGRKEGYGKSLTRSVARHARELSRIRL